MLVSQGRKYLRHNNNQNEHKVGYRDARDDSKWHCAYKASHDE